jgi:hypothetical protein
MKDPEHPQNPYAAPRSSASTKPLYPGDATAGRWMLIILLALLFSIDIFNLISLPQPLGIGELGLHIGLSIVLVAVLYQGCWWGRYLWLALLSVTFWVCCLRLWIARQPNPFFVALTIYIATFFYFLAFSRNVLAFLDAQRQRRTKR